MTKRTVILGLVCLFVFVLAAEAVRRDPAESLRDRLRPARNREGSKYDPEERDKEIERRIAELEKKIADAEAKGETDSELVRAMKKKLERMRQRDTEFKERREMRRKNLDKATLDDSRDPKTILDGRPSSLKDEVEYERLKREARRKQREEERKNRA